MNEIIQNKCQIIETKKNAFKEIVNDEKCNNFIADICIGGGIGLCIFGLLLKKG